MELESYHPSGTKNLKIAPRVLQNSCTQVATISRIYLGNLSLPGRHTNSTSTLQNSALPSTFHFTSAIRTIHLPHWHSQAEIGRQRKCDIGI